MNNRSSNHFFIAILIASSILAVFIFIPFLTPVVLATTLAVVFSPMHHFILRKLFPNNDRSSVAAFISIAIVAIIVIIPGFLIAGKLYEEIQNAYYFLTEESSRSTVIILLNNASERLSDLFFNVFQPISFDSLNVTEYFQSFLEWAYSNIDTLFNGISKIGMGLFIAFLALFYFLRDGREFKKNIISLSPLGDEHDERILKRLEQTIYSIVAGSLIVGLIQGILTGIGFAIFGVPSPAIWGSIAAVAALIPGFGTSLVIVPGILYLFFTGSTSYAIGLLVWGMLAVGLIDNTLGPILMNKGINIHPFFILLSVLGGISLFGVVGFILGPLVLAFVFALLEIYRTTRI